MSSSKKFKVVIDTNVFISGIFFGGNPLKTLRLWQRRKIELVISPELEAEIIRKLKAFYASEELLTDWKRVIEENSIQILPKVNPKLSRDPKDNFLLAAALTVAADYLITSDKDPLILGKISNTKILKPSQFIGEFK